MNSHLRTFRERIHCGGIAFSTFLALSFALAASFPSRPSACQRKSTRFIATIRLTNRTRLLKHLTLHFHIFIVFSFSCPQCGDDESTTVTGVPKKQTCFKITFSSECPHWNKAEKRQSLRCGKSVSRFNDEGYSREGIHCLFD
ncbi:hypothetical protein-signal peptide and transmembrane prediction [Rhodopirellula baltica SH 1]|uniref:Uncharacterized protein n=1 Tax=Rhodopirellula baltica (strain DSM 10527 / NCIMB 13988 / SH1) TaxID=243090 RepID=Q7UXT0_RHOBA|nr:hypothetical protein-signal peptide and transmembrane prediction [Rhodopirellula baltica SH 1]